MSAPAMACTLRGNTSTEAQVHYLKPEVLGLKRSSPSGKRT